MTHNAICALQQSWANLMVDELARCGVTYFCLSPGSRSTPLTLAIARNKRVDRFVHLDERACGFHAMGYAAAKKGGVAIVTTSGTAVANLMPAVIEASKKKIPLIILTADRPPELRQTGANQTIDQIKIFGEYVRSFTDLPVPTNEISTRFVLTTIDNAVYRSKSGLPGPVHLNCMFREPFIDPNSRGMTLKLDSHLSVWKKSGKPYTKYTKKVDMVCKEEIAACAEQLNSVKSGVIVVGKLPDTLTQKAVLKIADRLNWPIFPDITSGLRLGAKATNVIAYYDQLLSKKNIKFDGVLHLGGRLTSKRWYQYVEKNSFNTYMLVLNHPLRNDPLHCVTHRVHSPVGSFCQQLIKSIDKRSANPVTQQLANLNSKLDQYLDNELSVGNHLSEPGICRSITEEIGKTHALYVASSLPIREFDTFASAGHEQIPIGSNRGASGIDGTIASAAGFAKGLNKRVTLVIGDLAFLYDLNALSMLKNNEFPMTVVVLNNDGGGIFEFLPISNEKDVFEECFAARHGLSFSEAAAMYDLEYFCPAKLTEFRAVYRRSLQSPTSSIIEIQTDRKDNQRLQIDLLRKIKKL